MFQEVDIGKLRIESPDAWKKALQMFTIIKNNFLGQRNPNSLIEKLLLSHVYAGKPIPFLAFWGVGGKPTLDQNDERLFNYYLSMFHAIREIYPIGDSMDLLLADIHGQFNGFRSEDTQTYLLQVDEKARGYGWKTHFLSDLYMQYGLRLPEFNSNVIGDLTKFGLRPLVVNQLIQSAQKHNLLYPPNAAAYLYCQMRVQEIPLVVNHFPGRILMVNGSRDYEPLLPNMAIGYTDPNKGGGPSWFA